MFTNNTAFSGIFVNLNNEGTLNNFGTFNNNTEASGAFSTSFSTLNNDGTLNNYGTINNVSSTNFGSILTNAGMLNNIGGTIFNETTSTITNSGTLNNTLFGILTNAGTLNNTGTLSNTLFASLTNSGTINNSGNFTNSGAVTITSSGVFTTSTNYTQTDGSTLVNGTLTATGSAIVNIRSGALGGNGTINGNVLMSGIMMPGGTLTPGDSPGTLTIFGSYEQTGLATFDELMSPLSQSLLDVNGNVTLDPGALLEITLLNGFNPFGQTFDIMNYSALSGEFVNGSSFWDDGYLWDVDYGQNQIDITAVKAPEPGTFTLLAVGLIAFIVYSWRKQTYSLLRRLRRTS